MRNQWETFKGRQYRATTRREPRVTLGHKGTFYLNGIAYDLLGRCGAVEMLYDEYQRMIGLKPTDPRSTNAFAIKHHGKAGNYKRISAAAFCQHLRLRYPGTMIFNNVDLDDDGVLRLDMTSMITVSRGAR